MPIETGFMIPLVALPELTSHEKQFLAGMCPHVSIQQSQAGESLPFISRHASDQRAFAVDDFIMRERQHEILTEGVPNAEGDFVLVVFAMDGIAFEIRQR